MRAVAATLSMLLVVLMLAQPVLAGKSSNMVTLVDAEHDLMKYNANFMYYGLGVCQPWPVNSPVQTAEYLDMEGASIEKQRDTFVLTLTMYCDDLLADVEMPIGGEQNPQIAWTHYLVNLDDGSDYLIGVWWDGSKMSPLDLCPDLKWEMTAADTITMWIDEDMMGDPSSIAWSPGVLLDVAPVWLPTFGGWWWVDMPDNYVGGDSGYYFWPA